MEDDDRQAIALWRFGVLGPLVSARLEHGDRRGYFKEAASRTHQMPDGTFVSLSARTIESWYFAVSEAAWAQEYGLKQAILKHGPPLAYYVDLGPAYIPSSLKIICAEIGTHLLHTGVRDCEAKGVIERWHETWRAEVGDELPSHPLPLSELNSKHWAWLAVEYHARIHDTTQRAPLEHWLSEAPRLRRLPRELTIDDVFLHREKRTVRKDGTVRFRGGRIEVRPDLSGDEVELRFAPADEDGLPRVFQGGRFVCDTVRLDRLRNASRPRRRFAGEPDPLAVPTGLDPLALMEAEHYGRIRPLTATSVRNHDDDDTTTER